MRLFTALGWCMVGVVAVLVGLAISVGLQALALRLAI